MAEYSISQAESFRVSKFQENNLALLIRECFGSSFPNIVNKNQVKYLVKYLTDLGTKTIVCENEYIDKNYLDDYSKYYVNCFTGYSRFCARLHFFSDDFNHKDFTDLLNNQLSKKITQSSLNKSYSGFIVIKPLPLTFLGKVCLRPYPTVVHDPNKFLILRNYYTNLFGIDLTVKSIGFQEQDQVVSACATTAIWSQFQGLKDVFPDQKNIPSLSQITLSTQTNPSEFNEFPNEGLSGEQVLKAIKAIGLRGTRFDFGKETDLKIFNRIVLSYISSCIPIFLGASVIKGGQDESENNGDLHAVCILGYVTSNYGEVSDLYLHDDRIGPFTRFAIDSSVIDDCLCIDLVKLDRVQEEQRWEHSTYRLRLRHLTIATHTKIRIGCLVISGAIDRLIEELVATKASLTSKRASKISESLKETTQSAISQLDDLDIENVRWRVRIKTNSVLKREYLLNSAIKNKEKLLSESWPRNIWVVEFYQGGNILCHFLFDSTDIPQGNIFITHIPIDRAWSDVFIQFLITFDIDREQGESSHDLVVSIIRSLKSKSTEFFENLLLEYGPPRLPETIEDIEAIAEKSGDGISKTVLWNPSSDEDMESICKRYDDPTKLIWAIGEYGELIIGKEINGLGHPSLTGSRPGRIAGEILRRDGSLEQALLFEINAKSGRYSSRYDDFYRNKYLESAVVLFKSIFPRDEFKAMKYNSKKVH
jgi:hypothetical protein